MGRLCPPTHCPLLPGQSCTCCGTCWLYRYQWSRPAEIPLVLPSSLPLHATAHSETTSPLAKQHDPRVMGQMVCCPGIGEKQHPCLHSLPPQRSRGWVLDCPLFAQFLGAGFRHPDPISYLYLWGPLPLSTSVCPYVNLDS